ncbi:unnamed protein product [Prunus brigantina]
MVPSSSRCRERERETVRQREKREREKSLRKFLAMGSGLGDSLVFFSIFFALLLFLWADPSSKYRSVDGYPGRCFMNYTSQVSLALPMVIESEAKAQKIRYSTRKNPHRLKAFNA